MRLLLLIPLLTLVTSRPFISKRLNPTYAALQTSQLSSILDTLDPKKHLDFTDPKSSLSQLLVPRTVGSLPLRTLQNMVQGFFENLGWTTEIDAFTAPTPEGIKSFRNLIFLHNATAPRRLFLSAHIDSKISPEGFVGATDSSVPCAVMMDVAEAVTPWLNAQVLNDDMPHETLGVIFFDGEEAFHDWSDTDSIYGARHLVEKWSTIHSVPSASAHASPDLYRISHLILLDLLGTPDPTIRSWFPNTGWFFDELINSEAKLAEQGLLWEENLQGDGKRRKSFFVSRGTGYGGFGGIEDDHIPFLRAGIPVLHIIPSPFPRVWHTMADNKDALDYPTVRAWGLIMRLLVTEYLGIAPSDSALPKRPIKKPGSTDPKRSMSELVN